MNRRLWLVMPILAVSASLGAVAWTQNSGSLLPLQAQAPQIQRPNYDLDLRVDTELRTLSGRARVGVPVKANDPLRDVSLFLYANASAPEGRKHLVVDEVTLDGSKVPWTLDGLVLKVQLPTPQTQPFALEIAYHGIVPESKSDDGLMGGLGGMLGADVSGLLGLPQAPAATDTNANAPAKKKTTDYGLYGDGDGIISLGAFCYPQLAVRENGKWADHQPESLGDLAHAEMSDFRLNLQVPEKVVVVAPGQVTREGDTVRVEARNRRDFALVMSDRFVSKAKTATVGGKPVRIESFATRENAARLDESIDVVEKSLQVFAKRFGPYLYDEFKIVESPLRGGAGGMEYSGMTGIASMLYGDFSKQLGGLTTSLGLPGADELLRSMGDETLGNPNDANPMGGMLGGILGQQKETMDSMFETTLAHEVAHQWFAIGVGSDSQNHPFVDESLTNWATILYFQDRYGAEKAAQMTELHLKTSFSMGAMLGGGDRAANLPASAYTNNLQYGAVIYGKGALFYQKLRELVGDEAFFGALREYYARYNGRLAGPNALKSLMLQSAPTKKTQIEALYTRWVEGAHGQEDIGGGGLGDLLGGIDIGGLMGGLGGLGGAFGGGVGE